MESDKDRLERIRRIFEAIKKPATVASTPGTVQLARVDDHTKPIPAAQDGVAVVRESREAIKRQPVQPAGMPGKFPTNRRQRRRLAAIARSKRR